MVKQSYPEPACPLKSSLFFCKFTYTFMKMLMRLFSYRTIRGMELSNCITDDITIFNNEIMAIIIAAYFCF